MIRISQINLKPGHTEEALEEKILKMLGIKAKEILKKNIVKKSIDARKKGDIHFSYTVDVKIEKEEQLLKRLKDPKISKVEEVKYQFPKPGPLALEHRPIIVGMGPAGLFCAYFLAINGYHPIVLERGKAVKDRQIDVETFWNGGALNLNSNVQFGEGGAGTFSDGKLNTLVKDKDGRNKAVLKTLVEFGAPEEILYESKPHIGTDILCTVVENMRNEIIKAGGKVCFESQVTGLHMAENKILAVELAKGEKLETDHVILAIGHSARDTFEMLYDHEVPMEAKSFAVGLRVEHSQEMINTCQYGEVYHSQLPSADYKVTAQADSGRGVYSFCMCPGGYVVNSSSEEGKLCVNGMSYSKRDGDNANSAIIVSVTPEDFGSTHPLAGIEFQRSLEEKAFRLGNGKIPCQYYGEFKQRVEGKTHTDGLCQETLTPQMKGTFQWSDVTEILPPQLNQGIVEGMEKFGRMVKGFNAPGTILSGVESRTSSPVRILRDTSLQSTIKGLYPCGEGAGYAGGIMSAAMDGLRVAEQFASCYKVLDFK